jgi:translation initiation factor RLI1
MPRKTVVLDYQACAPQQCQDGVCQAALLCKRKVLIQETSFEMPDTKASMCLGCAMCVPACPKKAVYVM